MQQVKLPFDQSGFLRQFKKKGEIDDRIYDANKVEKKEG